MKITENRISMRRPDDMHLHVRAGQFMESVVGHSAGIFGRAVIMPNLKPPVTTVAQAIDYHRTIIHATMGLDFTPLMTLYLTEDTTPDEIDGAIGSGIIIGIKYYPIGQTTNSDAGVNSIRSVYPVLERMQELDLPLLLHGEDNHHAVDIFDREARFIEKAGYRLIEDFPNFRIVFEHITTKEAVAIVEEARPGVGATITPQHMLLNRTDMLAGGIKPHMYCMPILKEERHREKILEAATSGNPKFFAGTDSAPHVVGTKHAACGCAGCFTAPIALGLYAQAFESAGCLDRLEDFTSRFGAEFYGLPLNEDTITLDATNAVIPDSYEFGDSTVVPLMAGQSLKWWPVR